MTAIVGFIDDRGVVAVAADTEVSDQLRWELSAPKIHRVGQRVVGCTGPALWGRWAAQVDLTAPFEEIADSWLMWAAERGQIGDAEGGHRSLAGALVLAEPGRLVSVGGDGCLVETTHRYCAEGSGAPVAAGALYVARQAGWDAELAVAIAIGAAATHAHGCGGEPVVEVIG